MNVMKLSAAEIKRYWETSFAVFSLACLAAWSVRAPVCGSKQFVGGKSHEMYISLFSFMYLGFMSESMQTSSS
jgi:hypothetical protein